MLKEERNVLTATKRITVALAGNPNVGKTVIFNALTGAHQHVGNWPGVTVERKEGNLRYNGMEATIVDLPGVYSLTAYSLDERIAREYLIKEKPDVTVVIVDASNIERNMYLVMELLELGLNLIIALNIMDEAEKAGLRIDTQGLSKYLNVPIIPMVAIKNKGIEELRRAIFSITSKSPSGKVPQYPEPIEDVIEKMVKIIQGSNISKDYPPRWLAIKLLEKDPELTDMVMKQSDIEKEKLTAFIASIDRRFHEDSSAVISEERYAFIHGLLKEFVKRVLTSADRIAVTDKLDKILTNRFLGIPVFLFIMWMTFEITFSLGGYFADLIDSLFGWLGDSVALVLTDTSPEWLLSLLVDGIIGGIGSVLVFVPNIFLLFLAISFLEGTGYMSRAAFVMDKIMHTMGLHGKSFIPMILGFGCNVPAIMATRTIESEKDRVLTILVNPLVSCSARLPIYTLFASIFFARHQGLVVLSLYVIGIVLAVAMANLFNKVFFKMGSTPLVMELPPYRLPLISSVLREAGLRTGLFLKKAGTIIFVAVVIIWLLAYFPLNAEYASRDSVIGYVGRAVAPVLKPLGFGYWQASVSLIFGTLAKEVVVGTFGTLFGEDTLTQELPRLFTPLSAYSFMLFSLIYIPCIASIGAIWREAGRKWALLALVYLPLLAYLVSAFVYQIGSLIIGL